MSVDLSVRFSATSITSKMHNFAHVASYNKVTKTIWVYSATSVHNVNRLQVQQQLDEVTFLRSVV